MFISMVALKATDSYLQHQAIWSLFPKTPDRKRDHLFRVENKSDEGQITVLLQSSTQPKSSDSAKVLQSKEFAPQLNNEEFYKFKLLAYPTKCISQGKRVVEIHDEDLQVQWLHKKLSGANVNVTAIDSVLVKSKKSFNSRYVCFEGVLQITNAEQVYQALIMGIGRQKHAGAGLLSLAKAS
ncbi:type I-E CRISPR-associated protein Cas6/Cse3/CasE [Pseudoalteromonas sp. S558]|uniref:type I-E CRISPR-associated protein Cas6/Cse3/CasE n=1 Tax=Pseudoalteromonas sp. S558 TaxID=2066515 RepID=UPI00110AD1E8|nr:type I-E CRISPR-associated protein Cas6/Cse3/CasE [Pseudoalteromonas sp. S558]TMO02712.1 type I-E CRISPR-associated protein Cas6/Cse3/CasE [Pseudoalteromonas sp. S558]